MGCLVGAGLTLNAQIVMLEAFRSGYFHQPDASTLTPVGYDFLTSVRTDPVAGGWNTGSATLIVGTPSAGNPSRVVPMTASGNADAPVFSHRSPSYPTLDALAVDYPDDIYVASIQQANGSQTYLPYFYTPALDFWSVSPHPVVFPENLPMFSAAALSRLDGINPDQLHALGINGFTPLGVGYESAVHFRVRDLGTGEEVYGYSEPDTSKGVVYLPFGVLEPGGNYRAELIFSHGYRQESIGPEGEVQWLTYSHLTFTDFTAIPEPSEYAWIIGGGLAAWMGVRRVRQNRQVG